MKESEYRKIRSVRNSGLGLIAQRSPAHYLEYLRQPQRESDAFTFGSYVHALCLTPDLAESDYHVFDESTRPNPHKDYRDTQNKVWKKQIEAYCGVHEKIMISMESHQRALQCKAAIARHGLANEVSTSMGVNERLVEWTDSETGLLCKGRMDRHRLDAQKVVDLKTTTDASKRAFTRSIIDYGYHRQGAFYLDGSGAKIFTIVAVESQPPYGVAVYDLSPEFLELGRRTYRFALKQIKICREKYGNEFEPATVWPSYEYYSPIGEVLSPPSWASNHDFGDY